MVQCDRYANSYWFGHGYVVAAALYSGLLNGCVIIKLAGFFLQNELLRFILYCGLSYKKAAVDTFVHGGFKLFVYCCSNVSASCSIAGRSVDFIAERIVTTGSQIRRFFI